MLSGKRTVHVTAMAHTQTVRDFSSCAYTQKTRNLCAMLKAAGYGVILYASEDNDAVCDELVTCITKAEILETCGVAGPEDILKAPFDAGYPHWKIFIARTIAGIEERFKEGDIIEISQGLIWTELCDRFSGRAIMVEAGVGYEGITLRDDVYRCFESNTWRHQLIGKYYGTQSTQGRFQDHVIPSYLNPADFPFVRKNAGDYVVYIGRMNEDKGIGIAAMAAERAGVPLITAGIGGYVPEYATHRGPVGPAERAELYGNALATFAPTVYMEPFGNVVIESQTTGTPVITTDFGAFVEINPAGIGFRCNTMDEFAAAIDGCRSISRTKVRNWSKQFWLDAIAPRYDAYFQRLIAERERGSWMSFS